MPDTLLPRLQDIARRCHSPSTDMVAMQEALLEMRQLLPAVIERLHARDARSAAAPHGGSSAGRE